MEHGALDLNNVVFSYFDLNLECLDQPELRIYIDVEFWRENNTGLLNKVKISVIIKETKRGCVWSVISFRCVTLNFKNR